MKPTGTWAQNALVNALQDLRDDYDRLWEVRNTSSPKYEALERRLAGMRRQAEKLIKELNPNDTAWRKAFGML